MLTLTKANLVAAQAASRDLTRPTLNALAIEPDGATVATDGHMLCYVTPAVQPGGDVEPLTATALMLSADVATVAKLLGKGTSVVDTGATNANGYIAVAVNGVTLTPAKQEGEFPDYRQVYPNATAPAQ